ncbi:SDR family oxidoreductase [Streptomyces sp. NPDC007325]|uniref:SDR family oxidoreductase n=1 Tax=Streptomyces sp. NPDC007325 TaxID=3154588 RepID=UPI0033E21AD2
MSRPYEIGDLTGAHVLLTGATGFIGQALLERLLTAYADTRVTVLVRPRGHTGPRERIERLLRKDVFRPWREELGAEKAFAEALRRVTVVEGDLASAAVPDPVDVVIHCASLVEFDAPIDTAFRTNVEGTARLFGRLASHSVPPHVVQVSTAYVFSARPGRAPETRLPHDADWRRELAGALAARSAADDESRSPGVLRGLMHAAVRDHGKAGPGVVALRAEECRRTWVEERLVDQGRSRARSLGWPDVYVFTKAMAERAAEELWEGRPLTVVRPAIVECALRHPYPGWIDGHKMIDPLIIGYGTGLIRDTPAAPDAPVDLVPVDLVVNAVLAAAATPPPGGSPNYFHLGTGSTNPLTHLALAQRLRTHFDMHPLPDRSGFGQHRHAHFGFPGAARFSSTLDAAQRAIAIGERVLAHMPATERTRRWVQPMLRAGRKVDQLRHLHELYSAHICTDAVFDDREARALQEALGPDRAAAHGFDVRSVDWRHYLDALLLPAVTARLRAPRPEGRSSRAGRKSVPLSGQGVLAVFDLEGTVVASDLTESYLWARVMSPSRGPLAPELLDLALGCPGLLRAERRARAEFVRAFLRRYAGTREDELRELVHGGLSDLMLRRAMPEALRRIRAHRAAGHRTLLVTGALDLFTEPLAPLFDEVHASTMQSRDGILTGVLAAPPVVGEARAAWLRDQASLHGLDLRHAYAYADSYSDRAFLQAVGRPCAVNPDLRLMRLAEERHWPVVRWGIHTPGRWVTLAGLLADRAAGRT